MNYDEAGDVLVEIDWKHADVHSRSNSWLDAEVLDFASDEGDSRPTHLVIAPKYHQGHLRVIALAEITSITESAAPEPRTMSEAGLNLDPRRCDCGKGEYCPLVTDAWRTYLGEAGLARLERDNTH